ncbi:hypothetical protein IV487_01810 [Enterococcus saccharolyticus]|uniref:hypothetical protein n=1 Tax=Enterococcus saccharolyticus TaxID=41997 RepID=UPI001E633B62|nr:hypothetical protein [Enterococcus saccharolyticus]MCD5001199.1 hypothetical protein [Enterococcus saccharolyticus]
MSELERLIEYLEGNLTISEPTMAYSLHNNEVAGYIEFLESLKQPTLNENQQIVLEYLKTQFGKHEIFVKSIFDPIQELLIGMTKLIRLLHNWI